MRFALTFFGIGILLLLLGAQRYEKDLTGLFSGGFPKDKFKHFGKGAEYLVQFDSSGMHVTFPSDAKSAEPAGLASLFSLHGDFEITVPFQIVSAETPGEKDGVSGFSLYVTFQSDDKQAATISRGVSKEKGDHFGLHFARSDGNKRQHRGRTLAANARSGKIRLQRVESDLQFLYAEGDSTEFGYIGRESCTKEPVQNLRLTAAPGKAGLGLDVRFGDLIVRYGNVPESAFFSWRYVIPVLAGIATLGLGILGLVILRKRRNPVAEGEDVDDADAKHRPSGVKLVSKPAVKTAAKPPHKTGSKPLVEKQEHPEEESPQAEPEQ